jgi:hypothetical protein
MFVLLKFISLAVIALAPQQEPLGEYWGTAEAESEYYRLVDVPLPEELAVEAGSFELLPDDRLAIATRRGDILLVDGAFDEYPKPTFSKFATGLDEIFGMAYRDGSFVVTQQTEVTRITDENQDWSSRPIRNVKRSVGFPELSRICLWFQARPGR